jgi:4-hydroxymandelate oxidase
MTPLSPIPADAVALADYEALAQPRMGAAAWAYLSGGAADETTLRDNRAAFERLKLQTRVLADLRGGHTRCTLFGQTFDFPVLLAPVALQTLAHPEGERASAIAALAMNTGAVLSTEAGIALEEVAAQVQAAGARMQPLWFQLYLQPDRGFSAELVRRAEAAGCGALVLTVDAPVRGPRHREQRAGWPGPDAPVPANLRGLRAGPPQVARAGAPALFGTPLLEQAARWDDIAWLKAQTRLPLLLKGVLSPHDAALALAQGVDGLIVSNHGGRVLDSVPASIDALPAVAAVVQGRVPLLVDGGIRRGTDVLKALALGASAVLLGRPYVHALAVAGTAGVVHVLHLLRAELEVAMALTGCRTLAEIGPQVLWPPR